MELNNNTRLLKLKDILFEDTDEFHELSMDQIIENCAYILDRKRPLIRVH